MLLVEGIPRQSVDRWNVEIKYSPLKRVLPVRYSRTKINEERERTEFDGSFCKKFKLLVDRFHSFFR